MRYLLALSHEPRFLVSISHTGISFNLNGGIEFGSIEEIATFKHKWRNHFFNTPGGIDNLIVYGEDKKPVCT